jgi:WD40 repeat protein
MRFGRNSDGKILASVGGDIRPPARIGTSRNSVVRLWEIGSGRSIREFGASEPCLSLCVDWTPDGKPLAVGYGETYRSVNSAQHLTGRQLSAGVRIWNVDGTLNARIVRVSEDAPQISTIYAVAWDHAGRRLVFGGRDSPFYVRDADEGTIRSIAVDNWYDLNSLAWKRDDSHILVTKRNNVREWRADGSRSELVTEGTPSSTFMSVSWSPEGEWLVSGGGDSVRLWKKDGTPGPVMTGHADEVYDAVWSPDGQWIASGSTDSTVRLWKPDGAPGPVLLGHVGEIHDLAWSPDSKRIVSGGWLDGTLRVWNIETGKTEWQALQLETDSAVTLSSSGQPLHGDRELLESAMWYLVEKPDGTVESLSFSEFRFVGVRFSAPNSGCS